MRVNLYLHKPIVEILRCYGDLQDVVNKILDEANDSKFDIMDKPPAPPREGAGRYVVDITNSEYIELLKHYPPNSSKLSLRRLLYWFVEEEMYNELGWKLSDTYISSNHRIYNNHLTNAIQHLERSLQYNQSFDEEITKIIDKLKAIQEASHV